MATRAADHHGVTTTGDFSTAPTITPVPVQGLPPALRAKGRRTQAMGALLLLALVAVVAGAAYVVTSRDEAPVDTRPVVLPDTFAGWGPSEPVAQFADDEWRAMAAEDIGQPLDGRAYGTAADRVRINVLVSRGDDPDGPDVKLAREPFTVFGAVSCTHTLQLPEAEWDPDPQPFTSDRMFICFRHDDMATVSAFVLMGAHGREADVAAAVDEVWALQQ